MNANSFESWKTDRFFEFLLWNVVSSFFCCVLCSLEILVQEPASARCVMFEYKPISFYVWLTCSVMDENSQKEWFFVASVTVSCLIFFCCCLSDEQEVLCETKGRGGIRTKHALGFLCTS